MMNFSNQNRSSLSSRDQPRHVILRFAQNLRDRVIRVPIPEILRFAQNDMGRTSRCWLSNFIIGIYERYTGDRRNSAQACCAERVTCEMSHSERRVKVPRVNEIASAAATSPCRERIGAAMQ